MRITARTAPTRTARRSQARLLAAAVGLPLVAIGCGSAPPAAAPAGEIPTEVPGAVVTPRVEVTAASELPPTYRRSMTAGRRWFVAWAPRPDPIPLNEPFALDVLVFDGADPERPRPDLEVRVDAAMPQHHHGMNRRPRVTGRGDGGHDVAGMLFHMPGDWELYVDVFEGTVSERARFAIELDG